MGPEFYRTDLGDMGEITRQLGPGESSAVHHQVGVSHLGHFMLHFMFFIKKHSTNRNNKCTVVAKTFLP